MSKEQVMDYVMNSPANTNKAVLSGMLDSLVDGESDSGSSFKMTLFDRTLSITQLANGWIYQSTDPNSNVLTSHLNYRYADTAKWIVNVDGEEIEGTLIKDNDTNYHIGVTDPAATLGTYKIGCRFYIPGDYIVGISMITLDASVFSVGDHSVKIYVELSA